MGLNDLRPIQRKILAAVAAGQDGEIDAEDLKRLFESPRSDSVLNSKLVINGLLEWSRRDGSGRARGIRITEAGRILARGVSDAAS